MKNNMNRKGRRAEKFRGYSPVRAAGGEAEKTKVGVEKGFGPRHGANAKEGDPVDLTKMPTDSVPALLTPREAVLNRNAAELAGRPEIEALNKEGNLLAQKGVDLAARGETSVRKEVMKSKQKHSSNGGHPQGPSGGGVPAYGSLPVPPPQAAQPSGGFYPPGMSKFAAGDASVPGGIGSTNPQKAYSTDPVDFKAPDLSGFLRDMQAEAKKRGLSQDQLGMIAKQFAGMGGGGSAPGGGDVPYDQLGGQYASFSGGAPGYQDGISEVGYPPLIAPNAKFDYDRGGWVGAYDPRYSFPGYARGNPDIPNWADPGDLGFNTGPGGFGRPSTIGEGGRQGSGYINRSSWQGGAPGFPWSPTMIPTSYNPQGYPFAVPVQGPDQNVQGVGRTHNLRQNQ